ncbi:MAG: 2-phosphosulfolactate phosphatase [Catalinimonas sp.]
MPTLDVCLAPELLPAHDPTGRTVVVIDVLRATSTMVAALAHGVRRIATFDSVEACLALGGEGWLTVAERDGMQVPGVNLGNSPRAYLDGAYAGRDLAMTTTNGTRALQGAAGASEVLIGAFLNRRALADRLRHDGRDVLLLCSGWKGQVNVEDTLLAGALVYDLRDAFSTEHDAPLMAAALYAQAADDPRSAVMASSHVRRLSRLGLSDDLDFCLLDSRYDVVPMQRDGMLVA